MGAPEDVCYTIISTPALPDLWNEHQLIKCLEEGNTEETIRSLKQIIHLLLNGEKFPRILITVIRYVLSFQDHTIKKLLQVFWEVVPKTDADGKLLEEMILVCDYFRKDLLHPNIYVRGSTLRLLCKLKEPELLEPLVSPIHKCLECHHSYVRKNAIVTILIIYKNFDHLIPDGPEVILKLLQTETDESCRRNAFIMLIHANQESALNYLYSCIDQIYSFDAGLQLIILEFIYKVNYLQPVKDCHFIQCMYGLMKSSNSAVRCAAAKVLVTLLNTPSAIKAAVNCYTELIAKSNDNNIKLFVLDHLIMLKEKYGCLRVMQDLAMDIFQVLTVSDLEVRQKILSLVQALVSLKNVADVVVLFRK